MQAQIKGSKQDSDEGSRLKVGAFSRLKNAFQTQQAAEAAAATATAQLSPPSFGKTEQKRHFGLFLGLKPFFDG